MSMEESFIRGCYYYYTDNSIWFIYRARMRNYLIGLGQRKLEIITEKDAEYLSGQPVPLVIKIPVEIEAA